ncbi:GNAT family N-acetyltransferase [Stutzerimonas tarimensis]|uniref:GNAT family N-acetyltransferase n=1 Tax=Stutzerimonas tarimensis TaxID=1507735 RepID=A0ABV7T563_9GAMM
MQIELVHGAAIAPYVNALADLRIRVFREFPYLYDGDPQYERRYLSTYADSAESLFVLAIDGDRVIGVSTGLPLADETEAFQRPFVEQGHVADSVFYFGESVLLPTYRGRGLGVRFFEAREGYARRLGRFRWCAFCAVERPGDHPLRPAGYQPLHAFWARRGYHPQPGLRTEFSWKDVDHTEETAKPMSFWLKELAP